MLSVILKGALFLALALGVALFVVVNYSESKQELTCKGNLVRKGALTEETAYVVLSQYRWWVHLWSDSDGNVTLQTDKSGLAQYIPYVDRIGDHSLASYLFKEEKSGDMVGGFRAANGEITFKLLDDLLFEGTCNKRAPA